MTEKSVFLRRLKRFTVAAFRCSTFRIPTQLMRKLKLDELGRKSVEEFKDAHKHPIVVVLDDIRSMINVGAVFRNCDAFLVEKVYLCGYTPTPPHREISKSALGAEEAVDWAHAADIVALVHQLKAEGYKIASIEQTDQSLQLQEFSIPEGEKWAIVLGNEVDGVNANVVALSDVAIEIPQFGTKHSLNIAVASGIVLYALVLGGND
jgi:23S rRNA (guanosine2251-2'-O)-methyltransferase